MIAITVSVYGLAKELGPEDAEAEFSRQVQSPGRESLPCVRTIHRLRQIEDVSLYVDFGASNVAKARCRQAHIVHEMAPEVDVWIAVDDDVEAGVATLQALIGAVRSAPVPTVVLAPCLLRTGIVNIVYDRETAAQQGRSFFSESGLVTKPGTGAVGLNGRTVGKVMHRCYPGVAGGFGLVAMARDALERTIAAHPTLTFDDDDGHRKAALFAEELEGGRWWGEDLSFFRRLPEGVNVEIIASGSTAHGGLVLDCAAVENFQTMTIPAPMKRAYTTEPPKAADEVPATEPRPVPPLRPDDAPLPVEEVQAALRGALGYGEEEPSGG